jgi:hypothetical protein
MKRVQRILSNGVVVITLAVTSFVSVYSVAQDKKPSVPTRKELVTLLKTAKEPPEHRRIAAYYRHEAASLTQSAKEHAELAAIYQQKHPSPQWSRSTETHSGRERATAKRALN